MLQYFQITIVSYTCCLNTAQDTIELSADSVAPDQTWLISDSTDLTVLIHLI